MEPRLNEIIDFLEDIAPLRFQEDYDNAGLILGTGNTPITGAIISLDCTEDVVEEAISNNCNLIISHHPIIFRGLKKFQFSRYVDRTIIKAIKNDISIYAIHTNLDNVLVNGVNEKIASKLQLNELSLLSPKVNNDLETNFTIGSGVIGLLRNPMTCEEFLLHVKDQMSCPVIRHTKVIDRKIQRVAVCGGAGSFLLNECLHQNVDAFVSSDFKYHEFFDANGELMILDIGHYESEFYTIELLFELLTKKFPKFAAHCTKVTTNPVNYF